MPENSTREIFIQKAKNKHGDKYNYDQVEYINNVTKVKIICPTHGEFFKAPNNHLSGQGCPKCGRSKMAETKGKQVIIYGKIYLSVKEAVLLFSQEKGIEPPSLLMVRARLRQGLRLEEAILNPKQRMGNLDESLDNFLSKAKIIHGGKYSYDFVIYKKSDEKVKILCAKHGVFEQTPNSHLSGCGCPECFKSSKFKTVVVEGKEYKSLRDAINILSEENNIIKPSLAAVRQRIDRGMTIKDAILQPVKKAYCSGCKGKAKIIFTEDEKTKINQLVSLGKTQREIAQMIGKSLTTVHKYLKSIS